MPPVSEPPSRISTPRSFANQTVSAEELLKSQTVGLVNLADFRKRRADVLEQKEKEAQDRSLGRFKSSASGRATPDVDGSDGALTPRAESGGEPPRKKKKKVVKELLSFGDEEDETEPVILAPRSSKAPRNEIVPSDDTPSDDEPQVPIRRLTPNPISAVPAPKVITKASLQAEAMARDKLRKEFLALQEVVKSTDILIPFVFYDGTNIPGGTVKVKKGDHIWLFLERCRKLGAELGVSGSGSAGSVGSKSKNDARREWARISVDDLLCVRGDVIIPHHYEFYYFIANRVTNPAKSGSLLFPYSNTAQIKDISEESSLLRVPKNEDLEGKDHDPGLTKVVDRRWYERNKHIYPASLWKEYEVGKEFEEKMLNARRDAKGNAFFFS